MNNPYQSNNNDDKISNISNILNQNLNFYDLQELLDIKPDETDEESIKARLNTLIYQFSKYGEPGKSFVDFFKKIKDDLFKNEEKNNSQEDLVIQGDSIFDAERNYNYITSNNTDTTNKELYQNSVNPLSRKTVQKVLNIDSRYRKNYDTTLSTNFRFDLPIKISNAIELKLNDLEMTNTYYVISETYNNNFFWIKFTTIDSEEVYAFIYIDSKAYYDYNLIEEEISKTFTTTRTDKPAIDILINFEIDLSFLNSGSSPEGTGKIKITCTDQNISNVELNFSAPTIPGFFDSTSYNEEQYVYILDLTSDTSYTVNNFDTNDNYTEEFIKNIYNTESSIDLNKKFGWMLGFRSSKVSFDIANSGTEDASTIIFGDAVVNFIGPKYFYLFINDYNNNYNSTFISSDENDLIGDNVFARINNQGRSFSVVPISNYQITTIPRYYFGPVNLDKIEIKITDEYGRVIDLNGSDISLTLTVTCIYNI